MRGEYKVRGGKLVAVELQDVDGVLTDVHISGDFFLEPDSALETLNSAVSGMPSTVNRSARVRSTRPPAGSREGPAGRVMAPPSRDASRWSGCRGRR